MNCHPDTPLALQFEAHIHPTAHMGNLIQSLVTSLASLQANGVNVHAIRVETRGMGDGYLQALKDAPELVGCTVSPLTRAE